MAARPDPEVGNRRAGDHRRADGIVDRRVFVQATPRVVWTTLHDPATLAATFPEFEFGPVVPSWPAAATTLSGRARLGLLREQARAESLEARPGTLFRMLVIGSGFRSEWTWKLEAVAGGTRVLHSGLLETADRWATILVRVGRTTLADRVEAHLRALKDHAEAAERSSAR